MTAEGEMVEHTITLNLTLSRAAGWSPPSGWDWTDLLDLGPDETCEVMSMNSRWVDRS